METIPKEEYEKLKLEADLYAISKLRGASKRKITEEEYEEMRRKGFEEISKQLMLWQWRK